MIIHGDITDKDLLDLGFVLSYPNLPAYIKNYKFAELYFRQETIPQLEITAGYECDYFELSVNTLSDLKELIKYLDFINGLILPRQ